LVDFDDNGRTDVLSGSWPGELYIFRRNEDGTFAEGETLKDKDGKPIHTGNASTVFAVDWNGNGCLDLPNTFGAVFEAISGDTPVERALQAL
jgi:hypothetical protein